MATEYWTQKDGTKISVDDMSVEHLRNTLKMIIRNRNAVKSETPRKNSISRRYFIGFDPTGQGETPFDDCDATEMDIY